MRTVFFTHCTDDWFEPCGCYKLQQSLRRFHPTIPFIRFGSDDISEAMRLEPRLHWDIMIPVWGRKLANEFDLVIHLDADSIVVDSLPELLKGDFDVAGVRNNDDFGELSLTQRRRGDRRQPARNLRGLHSGELEMAWKGLSPKILNAESARRRLADARRCGSKVVFTNGCFDILHAGHLSALEGARQLGDILVVGLNSDFSVRGLKGESRPVISQQNRASLLAGLACVDIVVIFEEPTPDALSWQLDPHVLVKGGDYTVDQIAGADFVLSRGGQVLTVPLVPGLSTTAILSSRQRS